RLLSSSHILDTKVAHLLFDTLHFGVALTRGDEISKIQLKDRTMSFHDIVNESMKKLSQTGVNQSNALMAEQLALRIKMLESWCIDKKKLHYEKPPSPR